MRKLTTSEKTRPQQCDVDEPSVSSDEDWASTDLGKTYNIPNGPQETTLKLVDVTGSTLTTTSIQLRPENASAAMIVEGIRG